MDCLCAGTLAMKIHRCRGGVGLKQYFYTGNDAQCLYCALVCKLGVSFISSDECLLKHHC